MLHTRKGERVVRGSWVLGWMVSVVLLTACGGGTLEPLKPEQIEELKSSLKIIDGEQKNRHRIAARVLLEVEGDRLPKGFIQGLGTAESGAYDDGQMSTSLAYIVLDYQDVLDAFEAACQSADGSPGKRILDVTETMPLAKGSHYVFERCRFERLGLATSTTLTARTYLEAFTFALHQYLVAHGGVHPLEKRLLAHMLTGAKPQS